MHIGGLVRSSLVDYPDRLCATIFTRGCNFRCPFCHNPHLIDTATADPASPSERDVMEHLEKRRGLLDGVVVTGGEPTLQTDLIPFLRTVKSLGYRVKLDTNGSRPAAIRKAIAAGVVDFIAMDLKAPLDRYATATGVEVERRRIEESIDTILSSCVEHEFRTTAVRPLHTPEDLVATGRLAMGGACFVLQRFVNGDLLDPDFAEAAQPFEDVELENVRSELESTGVSCRIR